MLKDLIKIVPDEKQALTYIEQHQNEYEKELKYIWQKGIGMNDFVVIYVESDF